MRIGGTETFARELSVQLGRRGWQSVLCFQSKPSEEVAKFLDLPNVILEVLEDPAGFNWAKRDGRACSALKLNRRLRWRAFYVFQT